LFTLNIMKYILPYLFCSLISITGIAQTDTIGPDDVVFEWYQTQEKAEFPGGEDSMRRYIAANLVIPAIAGEEALSGTIVLAFVVEKDGRLTEIKVVSTRRMGFGLEEAVIAVIIGMPKWKPAMASDKPVRMKMIVPIRIEL
jgi:protein TonB